MMKRIRVQSAKTLGAVAVVAQMFIFQACGGGNNPVTTTGSAGSGSQGSAGSGPGTAGTTGTGGTTGSGGSVSPAGSAGATGAGGGGPGQPSCVGLTTAGGMEPAKNVACVATDIQLCYRTCGPEKTGYKSETCMTSGAYAE